MKKSNTSDFVKQFKSEVYSPRCIPSIGVMCWCLKNKTIFDLASEYIFLNMSQYFNIAHTPADMFDRYDTQKTPTLYSMLQGNTTQG